MSAVLSVILRLIGWGGVACVLLFLYEEGIPGASRIPFLSSIPIVGDLTTGRVHAYAADQVKFATAASDAKWGLRMQGMVSDAQYQALAAQLATERSRRLIADGLATEAGKRADAALKLKTDAEAALDKRIAADIGGDGAVWTEEDIQWGKH